MPHISAFRDECTETLNLCVTLGPPDELTPRCSPRIATNVTLMHILSSVLLSKAVSLNFFFSDLSTLRLSYD